MALKVKGNVIAPTFEFDSDALNLGLISCAFPIKKKIFLKNTSPSLVNLEFRMITPDQKFDYSSIKINPKSTMITPAETVEIGFEFWPSKAEPFQGSLVVDAIGVQNDLCSLPITAKISTPEVILKVPVFNT